jgi:hypothetical protein
VSSRTKALRELAPLILFLLVASLFEAIVVLCAVSLGLQDTGLIQFSFQLPGTGSPTTLTISPLFELVPIAVVITLAFCWVYLTRRLATRRQEIRRGRVETFSKQKTEKKGIMSRIRRAGKNVSKGVKSRFSGISRFSERTRIGRPTFKSAFIVLLFFGVFTLIFILFAYPQLIYHSVQFMYRTNPGLTNFVLSVDNWANGVFGGFFGPISSGLLAASSGFAGFVSSVGGLLSPIASLDNAGKYLAFQNAAALFSVLMVLLYGERASRGYRYKR